MADGRPRPGFAMLREPAQPCWHVELGIRRVEQFVVGHRCQRASASSATPLVVICTARSHGFSADVHNFCLQVFFNESWDHDTHISLSYFCKCFSSRGNGSWLSVMSLRPVTLSVTR